MGSSKTLELLNKFILNTTLKSIEYGYAKIIQRVVFFYIVLSSPHSYS